MFKKKNTGHLEETPVVMSDAATHSAHTQSDETDVLGETLMSINDLLQYMTQMDYVKDMLLDVDKQANMVENIAASSEEISASISDISEYVVNSSDRTGETLVLTAKTITTINTSFSKIDSAFKKTHEAQDVMHP